MCAGFSGVDEGACLPPPISSVALLEVTRGFVGIAAELSYSSVFLFWVFVLGFVMN